MTPKIAHEHRREEEPHHSPETYGEHVLFKIELDSLVMLTQVRGNNQENNPLVGDIEDSLESVGSIHNPAVAKMTEEQLVKYIDFINTIWGSSHSLEEFETKKCGDRYYVIIAGHTRLRAMLQRQAKKRKTQPDINDSTIVSIYPGDDPVRLINLQLAENIHSKPSPEREAMAIISAYRYGEVNGLWTDINGFIKATRPQQKKAGDGTVNRSFINQAMDFGKLPLEIRDYVFAGELAFGVAVALGKMTDTIKMFVTYKLGKGAEPDEITEAYGLKLSLILYHMRNKQFTAKKSIEFLKSLEIDLDNDLSNTTESLTKFEVDSRRQYLENLRREMRQARRTSRLLSEEARRQIDLITDRLSGFRTEDHSTGNGSLSRIADEALAETVVLHGSKT